MYQVIDLSALPAPAAIEIWSFEEIKAAVMADAVARLNAAGIAYDVDKLAGNPVNFVLSAHAYREGLMRQRVNDAVAAVLAPLAKKSDLDNVVARVNVSRLTITPASGSTAAVMESDPQLLTRYLLAFDRPSAGSADRYRFEAFTVVPSLIDVAVIGFETHGRRGDVDIVLAGPGGRAPTPQEISAVYAACSARGVKPEATSISVIGATIATYTGVLTITIPQGPDPAIVQANALNSVWAAANARLLIGAQVPVEAISGAAYGPNIIRIDREQPAIDIPADPYTIPVMTALTIATQVAG